MNVPSVEAEAVRELRAQTGLGMLECKKALLQCGGDIALALRELRSSSGGPPEPEPEPME